MKTTRQFLLTFLTSLAIASAASVARAQEEGTGLACGAYRIVHINGVRTDEVSAQENLQRLRQAFGRVAGKAPVSYSLAYNATGGLPGDLPEVLAQKQLEFPGATVVQMLRFLLIGESGTLAANLINSLATYWAGWLNNQGVSYSSYTDPALRSIVASLGGFSGERLLLVPHSQGSLYANRAVEIPTSAQAAGYGVAQRTPGSIGIIAVATPAAYVAGVNKAYVTSTNDTVVDGLRDVLGYAVLAPNLTIALSNTDVTGHGFRETYLAQEPGISTIKARMTTLLGHLTSTAPDYENYALFSAGVGLARPDYPLYSSQGVLMTYAFHEYDDEENLYQLRSGGVSTAATNIENVARNCVRREVTAQLNDILLGTRQRQGACPVLVTEWRFTLPEMARYDEIYLITESDSYDVWGYADVSVVAACRR